jgi:chromosome partitioning protein
MAPKGLRFASVLVVSGAIAASAAPAWGQQVDRERSGERAQPPTELLEEYPLVQGRLRSRSQGQGREARQGGSVPLPRSEGEPEGAGRDWLVMWLVLGAAAALLVMGLAGRRVLRTSADGVEEEVPEIVASETEASEPPPAPSAAPAPEPPSRALAAPAGDVREARKPINCYAVVNQKGGVGKTTVSLALSAAAVRRGSRVLLLDLDPQASATSVLGADGGGGPTLTNVMLSGDCPLNKAVRQTDWGVDLAPADRWLRWADSGIAPDHAAVLPRQLDMVSDYDLLLIDCPPSLGALTINALAAASGALVVTEPTFLALHAMEELLDTLHDVAEAQNPSLKLAGVVLNRVETTAEHRNSVAEVEGTFGSTLWEPHIPKRAILQDAMRLGVPPQDLESHSHYATEIAEIFDALAGRIETTKLKA